jgi:hypothetical protein
MKKILSIVNGVALIATLFMNYLSNTGLFNGNTNKTISDLYSNYFTPAGYAFSIWGFIYLGLLAFVFYTGRNLYQKNTDDTLQLKIGWWFLISCFANSFWLVAWLYNYLSIALIIMLLIFISLLKIILNTNAGLTKFKTKDYLFVVLPFTVYFGWISVAFVANAAALLVKINWSGWGISAINWAIIMIIVAGLINLFIVLKRNLPEFGLVGVWAIMAISVANATKNSTIVYVCYIVASILMVAIIWRIFNKRKLMAA